MESFSYSKIRKLKFISSSLVRWCTWSSKKTTHGLWQLHGVHARTFRTFLSSSWKGEIRGIWLLLRLRQLRARNVLC